MAHRMTEAPTAPGAPPAHAPRVRVLLSAVEGADLAAALAVVDRQVYEPAPEVVVIGASEVEGVGASPTLEEAIAEADSTFDYLWLLHSDARPRPDALSALVAEVERAGAALGGSKLLVAASPDTLESVGSATDVFGEPYTGLDEGEIDLQQYDVVREVAFVGSASMLVRRDLAQGLRGLDRLLPPVAAGLDFSQRARLAGGRVVSVPSSEVYHQSRCEERFRGWREQAGRLRAMATAYSPLTLAWLVAYELLVSIVDSIVSLLLLRWAPGARHLLSWGWNIAHLPSLIAARRRFRPVRALGDEELFRFQARGSVRLREVGAELSGRALSVFDEDQALARGSRRVWGSPGIWGAVLAVAAVAFASRNIVFGGVPNVGHALGFEPPSVALDRWFAGWNGAGLGSPAPVHPMTGLAGAASLLWFGAEGAARTLLTIGFGVSAVVGMGRLAGRLGLRGPGRYLAGLVMIGGPGAAALIGSGGWAALGAAAVLPWAVRASFLPPDNLGRGPLTNYGWALLSGIPLALLSPLLAVAPLATVVLWKVALGRGASLRLAVVSALGIAGAAPFLLGDPGWVTDPSRRLGLVVEGFWPVLIAVGFLPLAFADASRRRLGVMGALIAVFGLILARLPQGGPGFEEAALILAALGAAILTATLLDRVSAGFSSVLAMVGGGMILLMSLGPVADGALGLPLGDVNDRLSFAEALADETGPGRVMVASSERADIAGEARPGPGFWYRVVDGRGPSIDEVWLPEPRQGDEALSRAVASISAGGELRPGSRLAGFAVDWVVLLGPPFRLDEVLEAQLELVPTPLDPEARVFENQVSAPLADPAAGAGWAQDGAGFSGAASPGRVVLAVNHDEAWRTDSAPVEWRLSTAAEAASARYRGSLGERALAAAGAVLAVIALSAVVWGRARR